MDTFFTSSRFSWSPQAGRVPGFLVMRRPDLQGLLHVIAEVEMQCAHHGCAARMSTMTTACEESSELTSSYTTTRS